MLEYLNAISFIVIAILVHTVFTLSTKLTSLYRAIRHVRDQRGDDRCWKDWHAVYALLPEGYKTTELDTEVELQNCRDYIRSCRDPNVVYVSPQRRIEALERAIRLHLFYHQRGEAEQFLDFLRAALGTDTTTQTRIALYATLPEGTQSK